MNELSPTSQPRIPFSHRTTLTAVAVTGALLACSLSNAQPTAEVLPEPTARILQATDAPTAAQPGEVPDLIFHNGVILTMDDARPSASALHVVGETIASVGDEASILTEAGPATIVIDLAGRTLMPGFVDAHSHMFEEPDLAAVQDTLLRNGVTTTADMYVDQPLLQRLQDLAAGDGLRMRLSAYLVYNTACGEPLGDWYSAYAPTREPGERLRIGGVKIFADGGSCNVPAVTFDYPGGYGQGDLYFTADELTSVLRSLDQAGWQIAVHALGDRAIDVVLAAYTNVLGGVNPHRDRIEHNAVVRPEQYPLYTQAGVVATLFGPFTTCARLGDPTRFKYRVPEDHQTWEWPWRELIEANPTVHFAWHSDMPHVFTVNTFAHLYGLVTRNQIADDGSVCQAPDWLASNALGRDQALQLMTMGAAYALDREAEVGSLAPGKFADMMVLSDNPLTVDSRALADLSVQMTMVGGNVEYCAEGMEALCPAAGAGAPTPQAASAGFVEDFDTAELAAEWSWIRENPTAWNLVERPGWLRMDTRDSFLLRAGGDAPLLLRPAPDGDFEIQTRLDFTPTANFHFAGLLVYQDDDHFVALGRAFCGIVPPCVGDGVYLDNDEVLQAGDAPTIAQAGLPQGEPIWLRLVRQGSTYTGYWSSDGGTWTLVGSTTAGFTPEQVGLMAATSASGAASASAAFDVFQVRE